MVHPALQPSLISRLPSHLKSHAQRAIRGSSGDMADLVNLINNENAKIPTKHLRYVLPVFDVALGPIDPGAILAALESAAALAPLTDTATRAIYAIRGLRALFDQYSVPARDVPDTAVLPDLIRRALAWIYFHDTFHSVVRFPEHPTYIYRNNIACLRTLMSYRNFEDGLVDSSDFFKFLGSAWAAITQSPFEDADPMVFEVIEITESVKRRRHGGSFHSGSYLPDFILGAGGRESFARTCAAQLREAFPAADRPVSVSHEMLLRGVINAIASEAAWDDKAFTRAACDAGLISAVVTANRAVQVSASSLKGPARTIAPLILSWISVTVFRSPRRVRHALFVEALQAGLLAVYLEDWRNLASTASKNLVGEALDYMESIPMLLLSRAVVAQLQNDPSLGHAGPFRNREVGDAFGQLRSFCEIRQAQLAAHDVSKGNAVGGCDNIDCGRLHSKKTLKRCSKCLQVQYCSRSCQQRDWNFGHRKHCGSPRRRNMPDSRSFLRLVLNAEYAANKTGIVLHLLRFFNSHPVETEAVPFLVFNIKANLCDVEVGCFTCLDTLGENYAEDIARARASGGRFQLHFVGVPQEGMGQFIPMPFYSPRGDVLMSRIKELAREMPRPSRVNLMDIGPYKARVEEMLEEVRDYPETY
ncbi:MYND-type domain-containing protein [Mycena kentingensis (nom. inval.)]|nr:MYND-type domain-containing protein [Mycena kentingensis (nom. inval.)]